MVTKGIEGVLRQHNGEDAVISISHKLYGNQKIQGELDCVIDENRIGFRAKNGQEIYIYRNEIVNFSAAEGLWFEDDIMRIDMQFK